MASVEFSTEEGDPIAVSTGSFMTAPDPSLRLPTTLSFDGPPPELRLQVP